MLSYNHEQAKGIETLVPYLLSDEKIKEYASKGMTVEYRVNDNNDVTILKHKNRGKCYVKR